MKIITLFTLSFFIFMPGSYVISQEDSLSMKSAKTITILSPKIERYIVTSDGEKKINQEGTTEIKNNIFEETRKLLEEKGFIISNEDADSSILIEGESVQVETKQHFKDWTKSGLLGIFTLGLVIRAPDNGWSILNISIIDNKSNKTLWTNHEKIAHRHLTSPRIVRHLIKRALKDFPEL